MLVRFDCPACKCSHSFDMPETTIHMTCAASGKHLELRLGAGGEVKAKIVGESAEASAPAGEES